MMHFLLQLRSIQVKFSDCRLNGTLVVFIGLLSLVACAQAGTLVPFPGEWVDNGGWANSPATLTEQNQAGGVNIGTHGFAQLYRALPALREGCVYRICFSGVTKNQIEKVVLQMRRINGPSYTLYASKDLFFPNGNLSADMQVRMPASTPTGQTGLFLIINGVGSIQIPKIELWEQDDFVFSPDEVLARGEMLLNGSFELGEGGWCLKQASVDDSPALVLDENAVVVQESPFYLRIHKPYRIRVEGEAEGLLVTLRGEGARTVRKFTPDLADGEWSEEFSMDVPKSGVLLERQLVYLQISSKNAGIISRLSLEEIDGTEDETESEIEAANVRFEQGGILKRRSEQGEPVDVVVRVAGVSDGELVTVKVRDWWENTVFEETCPVAPLGDGTKGFKLPGVLLPPGWFDTEVYRQDGQEMKTLPGELAVLPVVEPEVFSPDWVLGAHLQTWTRTDTDPIALAPWAGSVLDKARTLGIQSQRFHPPLSTKWWAVEPEKGKWVFSDELIDEPISSGLSVLGLLDGTAKYASTAPPAQMAAKNPWPNNWGVYPPKDEEDWRNYVRTMVTHFQDRVRVWEIWNEPDSRMFLGINPAVQGDKSSEEVYVSLVKAASEEIRAIDPDIKVVAGAITDGGKEWLMQAIDLGLLDDCDAISFHSYGRSRTVDRGTLAFADLLTPLKEAIETKAGGRTIELWDSESSLGWMPEGRAGIGDAETLLKGILARRAAGINRWYMYSGYNKAYPLHKDFRMLWGFNDRPLAIQPLLAANRNILGDTVFAENLGDESKGEHVYLFERKGRQVVTGWVSGRDNQVFSLPGAGEGRIVAQTGVEVGEFSKGQLPLTTQVRYFVLQPQVEEQTKTGMLELKGAPQSNPKQEKSL